MDKNTAFRRDVQTYLIGFFLAIALTAEAFFIALGTTFGPGTALILIGILGLIQVAVHLRFFLHIDRSKQKREDLDLILFTTLVAAIIILGTAWILGNLHERMHMDMGM